MAGLIIGWISAGLWLTWAGAREVSHSLRYDLKVSPIEGALMYTGLLLAPLWVVAGIGLIVWIVLSEILPEKMPRTGAVLKAGWLSMFGK